MSKVAKAAVGLMAATLVAKILGFGRELALASAYGASGKGPGGDLPYDPHCFGLLPSGTEPKRKK